MFGCFFGHDWVYSASSSEKYISHGHWFNGVPSPIQDEDLLSSKYFWKLSSNRTIVYKTPHVFDGLCKRCNKISMAYTRELKRVEELAKSELKAIAKMKEEVKRAKEIMKKSF